ncbi:DoxX family protein [uncultured Paraglaciecola sp.]|uniref:DoxX family protein n=1 Tax=uncultured Paraglaciecola sp. TaxID=1765024 RepID=UPI0030D7D592|tara:strand:+ start:561208 stop:561738 length:531 start_codon:yes stop_codon:yes gene_type:complete
MNTITDLYQSLCKQFTLFFSDISLLFVRLLAAKVFLASGLSKWNGFFDFNEEKYDLFLYEFFCPEPIREGALLLCDANTMDYTEGSFTVSLIETLAVLAGVVEVLLPVMLILGFFSRIGALGLVGMTLFIQLAVFPEWDHWWNPAVWWFVALMVIVSNGPGKLSLDHLLGLDRKTN